MTWPQSTHRSPYLYCSRDEAMLRERQGDIHLLESTDITRNGPVASRRHDSYRVIHRFYRSGTENLHSSHTRSLSQLQLTADYIVDIWRSYWSSNSYNDNTMPISVVYTFIMDRLAAVRQDLTRAYDSPVNVEILAKITRFYLNVQFVIESMQGKAILSSNSEVMDSSTWFDVKLHQKAYVSTISSILSSLSHTRSHRLHGLIAHENSRNQITYNPIDEFVSYYLLIHLIESIRASFVSSTRFSDVLSKLTSQSFGFPCEYFRHCDGEFIDSHANRRDNNTCLSFTWKFIVSVKQKNPSQALKAFSLLRTQCLPCDDVDGDDNDDNDAFTNSIRHHETSLNTENDLDYNAINIECINKATTSPQSQPQSLNSTETSNKTTRATKTIKTTMTTKMTAEAMNGLSCLLFQVLPELRMWRLLLANGVANKSDKISDDTVYSKLGMSRAFREDYLSLMRLCQSLSIAVVVEPRNDAETETHLVACDDRFAVVLNDKSVASIDISKAYKIREAFNCIIFEAVTCPMISLGIRYQQAVDDSGHRQPVNNSDPSLSLSLSLSEDIRMLANDLLYYNIGDAVLPAARSH